MKHLRVEDLMSRVVISLRPDDTMSIAKLEMDIARIRHLPVVDDRNRPVGVLSMSDVSRWFAKSEGKSFRVGDAMTKEVSTVDRHAPAHEAARKMMEDRIGSLPVVDDGRLVGMLTETDFLHIAERALRGAPLVSTQ